MPKTYLTPLEVRGYELDSFGHVNHSVYLNYLEHARWRMLEQEGITLAQITELKLWPVIAHIDIQYVKPAFMGDTLEVRTTCIDHGKTRFVFDQNIYRGDVQIIKAKVTSVVVNEKGRPVETPEEYKRLWQSEDPGAGE